MSAVMVFETVAKSVVVVYGNDGNGARESLGSGVVLPGGEIATNCHVIEGAAGIVVKYATREHPARLSHADFDRDVCTLTALDLEAPPVNLGSTKALKVGQRVYAIGAPQGLELTLSEGIISSLREVDGGRYIQTTAAISSGSSGGGLFDEEARLVGLPTFYVSEGQQLNFAVPVEWIRELPRRSAGTQKPTSSMVQWLSKAWELIDEGDWARLSEHARQWTETRPGDSSAWWALGVAHSERGQLADAIRAFQQAVRIDPTKILPWSGLGIAYERTGQYEKAIDAHQKAIHLNPYDTGEWNYLAAVYERNGQPSEAIAALKQCLRTNPEGDSWYNLGAAYQRRGLTADAIEAYRQALRLNPEDAAWWSELGRAYKEGEQTNKAIEAYRQALRIDPELAEAWKGLGYTYRDDDRAGHIASAIEAYRQAVRINPQDAESWFNLGGLCAVEGRSGEAMDVYRRLRPLDAKLADELFNIILP